MKKLLLLSIPVAMMLGMLTTNKVVEANYADFEINPELINQINIPNSKPWEKYDGIKIPKDFLVERELSLINQDSSLEKDVINEQEIQNEKKNFGNTIGRGLNVADLSPYAFKNNEKYTENIFKTEFLNELYQYGDYRQQNDTKSDYFMESNAMSLTTSIGTSVAVSTGVEAKYACVTAEASVEVGFDMEFSNTMAGSLAIYNYNYIRKTYSYNLPNFYDHKQIYLNHLTTTFKNDLKTALEYNTQDKYEEFFNKYGSHVLMSGFYGGASTVYGSIVSNELKNSLKTKESVATKVGAGLDAGAYKIKGTVGTKTSFSQGFEISTANSRETYFAEYYGGNAAPASHTLDDIFGTAYNWTDSIDSHPVCVKYDSVIPVWALLTGEQDTETNAYNLERAFAIYQAERENYYLTLAYQVEFKDNLKHTYIATPEGQLNRIAGYWSGNYLTFHKQVSLYDSQFYSLSALENAGFTKLQIKLKFKAKSTKNSAQVRVAVRLGGTDFGYGYYYSLKNDYTEINYQPVDMLYVSNLAEIMYQDSNLHLEFQTNSGTGFLNTNEKEAYIKDVVVEMIYTKPASSGTGVPNDPYLIRNIKELRAIENDLGAYYQLAQNIYFNNVSSWTPIKGTFVGTLNGNGYSFKNFKINKSGNLGGGTANIGLFETLGAGSWMCQFTFENASVTFDPTSSVLPYAGILCGMETGGVMYDCHFKNCSIRVTSKFGLVGIAAGYAKGSIQYCTFQGVNVYGKDVVGIVTGTLDTNGQAIGCRVTKNGSTYSRIELNAPSSGAGSCVAGGIAGYCFRSTVQNCTVEYTNFYLTGSTNPNPAMGYVVGHLNNSKIYNQTLTGNSKSNISSKYAFASDNGKVGKKEGTCTVA